MKRRLRICCFDDHGAAEPALVEGGFLEDLASATAAALGFEARVGELLRLPDPAYDRRRGQYGAADLLKVLAWERDGESLLLGVTSADLFVPRLNFVFGLADPITGVAVISLHRLTPTYYGEDEDPALYLERAAKEAVHELGHILGLTHCDRPECIMHFSSTIADTDHKGPGFCERCATKLP